MNLTVLYSGKERQHCLVLDMRWVTAGFMALLVLIAILSWQLYSYNARQSLQVKMAMSQNSVVTQTSELEALKGQLDNQLSLLAGKVGTMQAQLGRLNALGEHLVVKNNISTDEFDFSVLPPMGGPVDGSAPPSVELAELYQQLEQLEQLLSNRKKQLSLLETLLLNQGVSQDSRVSGKPVTAKDAWISSPFGMRTDPFTGKARMHKGIDFAGKVGTEVVATGSGVVSWAGKRVGYGKMVELIHGDGLVTRYAHTNEIMVKEGDVVNRGQVVATIGNSGRSTGPHLHYEVLKNGSPVDPGRYFQIVASN